MKHITGFLKLNFSCFPSFPWYYFLSQARLSVVQKLFSPSSLFPTFFQGRCIRSVGNFRAVVRGRGNRKGLIHGENLYLARGYRERVWHMKDRLHRNPGIRKEDRIKEGAGHLLNGSMANGNVGQQSWRWAVWEEGEEGKPLDETEAEDGGQMAHRELKE